MVCSFINVHLICVDWLTCIMSISLQEYWCKRLHPKYVCERVFRQPPLRDSLKKGRLKKQEFVVTKHRQTLLRAADFIGQKIQYSCPGFLQNKRQVTNIVFISLHKKLVPFSYIFSFFYTTCWSLSWFISFLFFLLFLFLIFHALSSFLKNRRNWDRIDFQILSHDVSDILLALLL